MLLSDFVLSINPCLSAIFFFIYLKDGNYRLCILLCVLTAYLPCVLIAQLKLDLNLFSRFRGILSSVHNILSLGIVQF